MFRREPDKLSTEAGAPTSDHRLMDGADRRAVRGEHGLEDGAPLQPHPRDALTQVVVGCAFHGIKSTYADEGLSVSR
jgi:hypothetical protein